MKYQIKVICILGAISIFFGIYFITTPFHFAPQIVYVPNISHAPRTTVSLCNETVADKLRYSFRRLLGKKHKECLQKAVAAFKDAKRFNVTYFLFAGALLGSYRHHDLIPWDKDVDLLVDNNDKNNLKEYLELQKPDFKLSTHLGKVWRFFHKDGVLIPNGMRWPYVDIFFYEGNVSHIWATLNEEMHFKYARKDVFPLTERPYMGMMLPAPRNSLGILSQKFDINVCKSNMYEMNDGARLKPIVELPCDCLKDEIPFVNRDRAFNATHSYERLEVFNNSRDHIMEFPTLLLPN